MFGLSKLIFLTFTIILVPSFVLSEDRPKRLSQLTFDDTDSSKSEDNQKKKEINYFPENKFPKVNPAVNKIPDAKEPKKTVEKKVETLEPKKTVVNNSDVIVKKIEPKVSDSNVVKRREPVPMVDSRPKTQKDYDIEYNKNNKQERAIESDSSEYNEDELLANQSEDDIEYGKPDYGDSTFGLQPDK